MLALFGWGVLQVLALGLTIILSLGAWAQIALTGRMTRNECLGFVIILLLSLGANYLVFSWCPLTIVLGDVN